MDADTKLILGAWRVLLVENHRLAGDCYRLERRVADLENILEKEYGYVGKRINYDKSVGSRRRIGIGHGGDVDGCD
jgi:hypothetical protein